MTVAPLPKLPDDPEELESLYRQDPETFQRLLAEASQADPDSIVLRVWRARLGYRKPTGASMGGGLLPVIAIILVFGSLIRFPMMLLGQEWYLPRFLPALVILALGTYFWLRTPDRRRLIGGTSLALATAAYLAFLPPGPPNAALPDSVAMGLLHLPIVFWALLGLAFAGDAWRETDARIRFIRYNGELLVLGSLVALGAMVFSGVTVALFSLAFGDIEEAYFETAATFGVVAVPVVATHLYDAVFHRRTGILAVLARVFAPLFLAMSVTYLVVVLVTGQNPFVDRSFLITFNALLLVVLGITIFSIVERDQDSPTGRLDSVNIALATVTLLINAIALAAIVFRLASYGLTPNRVAVLGANLLVMAHLAWICRSYVQVVRGQAGFADLRRVVASYLPVYVAWAALVAFVLPLLFGFA